MGPSGFMQSVRSHLGSVPSGSTAGSQGWRGGNSSSSMQHHCWHTACCSTAGGSVLKERWTWPFHALWGLDFHHDECGARGFWMKHRFAAVLQGDREQAAPFDFLSPILSMFAVLPSVCIPISFCFPPGFCLCYLQGNS